MQKVFKAGPLAKKTGTDFVEQGEADVKAQEEAAAKAAASLLESQTPMPTENEDLSSLARKRRQVQQARTAGRSSTILTDNETLG